MKKHAHILFPAWIALVAACLSFAARAEAPAHSVPPEGSPVLAKQQACPAPGQPITLSQVSQADCCKGHMGVCGCRAGKIVCCDNTVSPNCACHADAGIEN